MPPKFVNVIMHKFVINHSFSSFFISSIHKIHRFTLTCCSLEEAARYRSQTSHSGDGGDQNLSSKRECVSTSDCPPTLFSILCPLHWRKTKRFLLSRFKFSHFRLLLFLSMVTGAGALPSMHRERARIRDGYCMSPIYHTIVCVLPVFVLYSDLQIT